MNSSTGKRIQDVFRQLCEQSAAETDRMFAALLLAQWLLGILFAVLISPQTWAGEQSATHLHVYAALFFGGLLTAYPCFLVVRKPGASINSIVITIAQTLYSILLIHLTGGRLETHFHVFGSLAFLASYRDWRLLLLSTLITGTDHLLRGFFWPQSVYGVLSATPWRAIEHAAWVLFEDLFLFIAIAKNLRNLKSLAEKQVGLQENVENIEVLVQERTQALQLSQATITNQQQSLIASAKMSALGEMAGSLAHEINTPLATVKSVSSLIVEMTQEGAPADGAALGELASRLLRTTDRIAKIVQGLRSFSRDGSKDPFQSTLLATLIGDTLGFCSEKFKSNGVELIVDEVPRQLEIEMRPTAICQVLLNLLNNAFDAVKSLGTKWVRISVMEGPEWVEIQVTDSGTGISSEVSAKLFQPFFTTKKLGEGTGIGLSISRGIVNEHLGELKLDEQSKNTRFLVRLPRDRRAKAEPTAA